MTDPTVHDPYSTPADSHRPRHRREDTPVDFRAGAATGSGISTGIGSAPEPDLAEFGENPDTEVAG